MPFAPVLKKTTGLTGLAVCKNPQFVLNQLYNKIFRALASLPEESAYRQYTQEIVAHRMTIVNRAQSAEDIEREMNCGQIEEIIIQAENELSLARKFLRWEPWEDLVEKPPPNQWSWPPPKNLD